MTIKTKLRTAGKILALSVPLMFSASQADEIKTTTDLRDFKEDVALSYQNGFSADFQGEERRFDLGGMFDLGDYHLNLGGYQATGDETGWKAGFLGEKLGIEASGDLNQKFRETGSVTLDAMVKGNVLALTKNLGDNLEVDLSRGIQGNGLAAYGNVNYDGEDATISTFGYHTDLLPTVGSTGLLPFWYADKSLTSDDYSLTLGIISCRNDLCSALIGETEDITKSWTPKLKFKYNFN